MATLEYENGRQVDQTILNSYNLKTENNLDEYFLLLVGMEDDRFLSGDLPYIISPDCINSFNDAEASLSFISSQHDINMFVIISGQLGKEHVHKFNDVPEIVGVYVYCMNENEHKTWTKGITKIRCTVSTENELLHKLHQDIKMLSGRWPLGESSFQKTAISTSDWYNLFLIVICYRSKAIHESCKEMFKESRAYYQNHPFMLKEIDRVQQTYASDRAIQEYTKDSFIYRIINHALRTKNIEIVRKFSPLIRDLHNQIHDIHRKYYKTKDNYTRVVYRGQYLSTDELEYLRSVSKSNNPAIVMSTFISTSLDPEIAFSFISSVNGQVPCLFEIIIPDNYNTDREYMLIHEQAFAKIASISANGDEKEVLFSLMTHFSVEHIGHKICQSGRTWVPIQLELIKRGDAKISFGHDMVREWIEKENDPIVYNEVLDMLQINSEDELIFQRTNWQNWWNKLKKHQGKGIGSKQPLNLIFYDCFTEDPFWSRKAIDLQKRLLKSLDKVQSNLSSFKSLYEEFNVWYNRATIQIAIYEDYLERLCNEDKKEVVECLRSVGDCYKNISDNKRALECYQKAMAFNVNDKYGMNKYLQKQMRQLQKSTTKKRKKENPERQSMIKKVHETNSEKYENQQELRLLHEPFNSNDTINFPTGARLQRIFEYIEIRERWYDIADSRILLRLPFGTNDDLSVNDYRLNFESAVLTHISFESSQTDEVNNRSLSVWRYEKYLSEWMLCAELERFLQPFENKSIYICRTILPRLQRLIKKLLVLITLVIVYLCVKQNTCTVNVNQILSINRSNPAMTHLISADLRVSDLLADLTTMKDENPVINGTDDVISNDERVIEYDAVADFMDSIARH